VPRAATTVAIADVWCVSAAGQRLSYPTPGVPRTQTEVVSRFHWSSSTLGPHSGKAYPTN
jgi:hypothetical protein